MLRIAFALPAGVLLALTACDGGVSPGVETLSRVSGQEEEAGKRLPQRVAALEELASQQAQTIAMLKARLEEMENRLDAVESADYVARDDLGELPSLATYLSLDRETNTVLLTGANLKITSGAGATDAEANGLGNLIVGYDEVGEFWDTDSGTYIPGGKTGSHNLVVGPGHAYTNVGSVVFGRNNKVAGRYSAVTGGQYGSASGDYSSVSGGLYNEASGAHSAALGGGFSIASGDRSSICGGYSNRAVGWHSSVFGGRGNITEFNVATILGGRYNHAFGSHDTIVGGNENTANGPYSTILGGEHNSTLHFLSSIHGGAENVSAADLDVQPTWCGCGPG